MLNLFLQLLFTKLNLPLLFYLLHRLSVSLLRMKRGEKKKAFTLLLWSTNVWAYFILFSLNPFVANGTCQDDEPIIKRVCKIPQAAIENFPVVTCYTI